MTSATDELRRMLDEQGLEWREHEAPATDCIAFFDGNGWHDCWESVDGEVNVTFSMTPEQAIAATLGRWECAYEIAAFGDGKAWFQCSECGGMVSAEYDPPKYCPHCGRKVVGE